MPLVRVTMIKGKSREYIKKMSDSIYEALVEAYEMSENDLFQIIEQLEPGNLIFDRHYGLTRNRSNDFMIVNIQSDARRRDEKEAFMARLSVTVFPHRKWSSTPADDINDDLFEDAR